MLYFWIVFCSLIAILILGITFSLWSNTVIYISYTGESLQIKIKNIFFRYSYPSKRRKKNDNKNNENKKNKSYIKNKISKFIKETSSSVDSEDSEDSENAENMNNSETDTEDDGNGIFGYILNSFKGFDKDKKDTLILVKDILYYLVKYLRYKLYINKFRLSIDYGSGDAADTGIACGAFWTGYGVLLPILSNYFYLSTPSVRFTPWFNNEILEIGFESIIQVKLGHIINAIILSAVKYFKKHLMNI